jgi:SAM-dependent methyltransferase
MENLTEKQNIEINYWKTSSIDGYGLNKIDNLINKISEVEILINIINKYRDIIPTNGNFLEIGSGQAWASCVFKKLFPSVVTTSTDISEYAILSADIWERVFNVNLDKKYSCLSYEVPEPSDSFDFIFCFSAAHHFILHEETITEINRLLKKDGVCIYMYEPTANNFFYKLAKWRVNRKRPEVPEDVLIPNVIKKIAKNTGLKCHIEYYLSTKKRGKFEFIYYTILSYINLYKFFPCTANIIFIKN